MYQKLQFLQWPLEAVFKGESVSIQEKSARLHVYNLVLKKKRKEGKKI